MADKAMLLDAGRHGPGLGKQRDGADQWRVRLAELFPEATGQTASDAIRSRSRRLAVSAAIQVALVGAAAMVLLLRVAGVPAWDGTYAEDNGVFLVDGLVRPWHLFVPYGGYLELGPRVIGQFVASFAPLDIVDSGVDSPWYPMAVLFFAALWRPRSWAGMLAAALVACYASSSEIVALIYAPVLLIRLLALPRVREHAVTVGWHLSVWLKSLAGYNGATVIVGTLLVLAFGWAWSTGDRRVRVFVVVALLTGFVQTAFDATISRYVVYQVPTGTFMPAARYSTIPVLLITASGIVVVDSYVRRQGGLRQRGTRPLAAAAVLACLLGFGWVTGFRVRHPARPRRPLAALRAGPGDRLRPGPDGRRHRQRLGRPPLPGPLRENPPLAPKFRHLGYAGPTAIRVPSAPMAMTRPAAARNRWEPGRPDACESLKLQIQVPIASAARKIRATSSERSGAAPSDTAVLPMMTIAATASSQAQPPRISEHVARRAAECARVRCAAVGKAVGGRSGAGRVDSAGMRCFWGRTAVSTTWVRPLSPPMAVTSVAASVTMDMLAMVSPCAQREREMPAADAVLWRKKLPEGELKVNSSRRYSRGLPYKDLP
jgi:hypothetical protein